MSPAGGPGPRPVGDAVAKLRRFPPSLMVQFREAIARDLDLWLAGLIERRAARGIGDWLPGEVEALARMAVSRVRYGEAEDELDPPGPSLGVIVIERGGAAEAAL